MFAILADAIEPIALPGSALTDVAWDAGRWNCGTDLTLGGLNLCSVEIAVVVGTGLIVSVWIGAIDCANGTGTIGTGEQKIGGAGKIVL